MKFQCKQVSFSFSPSTPFSLSLLSDLKGLFTTTALISFPLTHCNLAPALPIQTNSPRSQMTSFWLTRGISVSSLTFLSNLIPLITFFQAWLLWQYPLVAFHQPSLLLFQHLLQQLLLSPFFMELSQIHYRLCFLTLYLFLLFSAVIPWLNILPSLSCLFLFHSISWIDSLVYSGWFPVSWSKKRSQVSF